MEAGVDIRQGRETLLRIGGGLREVDVCDVELRLCDPQLVDADGGCEAGNSMTWSAEVGFFRSWEDPPFLVILGQWGSSMSSPSRCPGSPRAWCSTTVTIWTPVARSWRRVPRVRRIESVVLSGPLEPLGPSWPTVTGPVKLRARHRWEPGRCLAEPDLEAVGEDGDALDRGVGTILAHGSHEDHEVASPECTGDHPPVLHFSPPPTGPRTGRWQGVGGAARSVHAASPRPSRHGTHAGLGPVSDGPRPSDKRTCCAAVVARMWHDGSTPACRGARKYEAALIMLRSKVRFFLAPRKQVRACAYWMRRSSRRRRRCSLTS